MTRTRWLRLLPPFAAAALAMVLPAADLLARAGGGEGYSGGGGGGGFGGGGGGGGGGGDGGDIVVLVYYWIRFCVAYPYVGLPVTAGGVALFLYASGRTHRAHQTSVIRRGLPLVGAQHARQAAAQLQARDPAFDERRFYERVARAFHTIQHAWCNQDLDPARPFCSDGVAERFALQIREQRDLGWRDVMEGTTVRGVMLAHVSAGEVFTAATVRIDASARNYRVSLAEGRRLSGSAAPEEFVEYWTFLRRSDAQTTARDGLIEGRCPNCGAAIEMNQNAHCAYCQSLLRSGRHDWVLVEITQAYEWRPVDREGRHVPGLEVVGRRDPELSLAAVEDRASVLFWRWAMAERTGDPALLRRSADDAYLARRGALDGNGRDGRTAGRTWLGECAVGSVDTVRVLPARDSGTDRAVVEVRWMGTRFEQRPGEDRPRRGGRSSVLRTLMVLGRDASARSDADRGVTSAHCPNCGAPEIGGADPHCTHCGVVLNDGRHGWVLLDVVSAMSREAEALLSEPVEEGSPYDVVNGAAHPAPSTAAFLEWMAHAATADGHLHPREREWIAHVAARRRVPAHRLATLFDAAEAGTLEPPHPTDRDEARQWLAAMAQGAWADGRLAPEEQALLTSAATRAGFSDYDLRLILQSQRREVYRLSKHALRDDRRHRHDGNGR